VISPSCRQNSRPFIYSPRCTSSLHLPKFPHSKSVLSPEPSLWQWPTSSNTLPHLNSIHPGNLFGPVAHPFQSNTNLFTLLGFVETLHYRLSKSDSPNLELQSSYPHFHQAHSCTTQNKCIFICSPSLLQTHHLFHILLFARSDTPNNHQPLRSSIM
jgi:hypothetical protein